MQHLALLIAPD